MIYAYHTSSLEAKINTYHYVIGKNDKTHVLEYLTSPTLWEKQSLFKSYKGFCKVPFTHEAYFSDSIWPHSSCNRSSGVNKQTIQLLAHNVFVGYKFTTMLDQSVHFS